MTTTANRQQLEEYTLTEVHSTGKKVGHGAYGYVEEVEVSGALCAAKMVYKVLVHNEDEGVEMFKQKFYSECIIMSKLRHPHVVQFLGVYFPSVEEFEASVGNASHSTEDGLSLPWLIMEYLPINLDNVLERSIPYSVKVSLLLDISKGLFYLHSQNPAIVHRDLTAKNILITSSMVAKIADFGVARIIHPMVTNMSLGPGNVAYMPPEVLSEGESQHRTLYFTSIDIFSFGVNILHTIIQERPLALKPAVTTHPETKALIPLSEIERRQRYFDKADSIISETSPEFELIGLAKRCLQNHPPQRPRIEELFDQLKSLGQKLPNQMLRKNKLELMELAMAAREQKLVSSLPNGTTAGSDYDAALLQENRSLTARIDSLEVENSHLQTRITHLDGNNQGLRARNEQLQQDRGHFDRERLRLEEETRRLESLLAQKEVELSRQLMLEITNERRRRADFESMQQDMEASLRQKGLQIERLEEQLDSEMQISKDRKLTIDLLEQQVEELKHTPPPGPPAPVPPLLVPPPQHQQQQHNVTSDDGREKLKSQNDTLLQQLVQRETENAALKTEAQLLRDQLLQKSETIEHLKRDKGGGATSPIRNLPPSLPESGIKVTLPLYWKKCLPMPSSLHCAQCILFNSNLLYGGGSGVGDSKRKIIRFDLHRAKWEEFSIYLYESFSMSVVFNKLLVAGGYDAVKDEYSNRLSEWREVGCNWVRIQASPLPVARANAAAVGFKKWLILAGGFNGSPLDRVDILDCENFGQWHTLTPLPEPTFGLQSTSFQDTSYRNSTIALWYLVGTNRGCGLSRRRPVFCISIPHLIERRVSWSVIPDPPLCNSGVVTVRGHLLAVGGHDQHATKKDVHMYLPGTNEWLKVSEIQYPRHSCSCVALSDKKFVVLGGHDEESEYSCKVDQYNLK